MGKTRVKFTFLSELLKEPVIYHLGQNFDVVTNIRRADVGEDVGWVVLELDGEDAEILDGFEVFVSFLQNALRVGDFFGEDFAAIAD